MNHSGLQRIYVPSDSLLRELTCPVLRDRIPLNVCDKEVVLVLSEVGLSKGLLLRLYRKLSTLGCYAPPSPLHSPSAFSTEADTSYLSNFPCCLVSCEMLPLRYESGINGQCDSEAILKNMCTRRWYSLEWGWAEGPKGEWEGFVLIRSLFSFKKNWNFLVSNGQERGMSGGMLVSVDPEQGESGSSGAGLAEASGLSFSLCLLVVLSPHFGFGLQFRPAFALPYLLTALKSILQLPPADPTDSSLALSWKFQRRAGVGPY